MTRHTAASNAAAIAEMNLRFDRLEALIVGMAAEQPAKTARKAPAKKTPAYGDDAESTTQFWADRARFQRDLEATRTEVAASSKRAKTAQAKSDRLAGGKGPAVAAKPAERKALCKATRLAFIAAAKADTGTDFSGMSTKAIALMCIEEPSITPVGFRIGEGYARLLGAPWVD